MQMLCWLRGQYSRVRSGRANEYQLMATDAKAAAFKQQQTSAFPYWDKLEEALQQLGSHSESSQQITAAANVSQSANPAMFVHLKRHDCCPACLHTSLGSHHDDASQSCVKFDVKLSQICAMELYAVYSCNL